MSDFINTVDIVDDDILMDGLIERSISGSFNDDKITSIKNGAFYGCTNLESVCFPNATSIGVGAFTGSGIKTITPETFPKVTSFPYTYSSPIFENSALETIDWPSLTELGEDDIFPNCTSLKSVSLPNLYKFGSYGGISFTGCTSLTDVNLPLVPGRTEFTNCTSLETITLPCSTDGSNFENCTSLQLIDLPVCTTFGGNYHLSGCSSLKAIILRSPTMCTHTGGYLHFVGSGIAKGTGYIYVPRDLIDSYKTATNWSSVASQFRPLEDYTVDGTITGTMREHCESFSLNVTELTFTDANPYTLTPTVQPGILDEVTWTTSDKTVARVFNGVVTPIGEGTATITVTYGEHSATCEVTVNDGIGSLNILSDVGFNNESCLNANGTTFAHSKYTYTDQFDISNYAGLAIEVQLIDVPNAGSYSRICYYDANKSCVGDTQAVRVTSYGAVITSTVPNNAVYAAISVHKDEGFSSINILCSGGYIGYIDYAS